MRELRRLCAGCLVLSAVAAAATALAADEDIHIKSERTTSLMWAVNDQLGFRWDIATTGCVSDGSNDAYDGGLNLQTADGNVFTGFASAKINKEGDEIEIGPWQYQGLRIWRRIHVNAKGGYCRWIDIFENPGSANVTVALRYASNMGDSTFRIASSSGKAQVTAQDWGAVTSGQGDSSRPALVHVFASPEAKVKPAPQFPMQNDNIYYTLSMVVPAGKASALCFFEAQRRGFDEGSKFLKDFKPSRELRDLPQALRRILVNIGDVSSSLGTVELRRSEEADLIVLRQGGELLGTITNSQYVLKSVFGELKVPAKDVIGLAGVSSEGNRVRLVLTGGQVILGELSEPLTAKVTGGTELKVQVKGLEQAAYRVSTERPAEITLTSSLVGLRTGEQVAFNDSALTLEFLTAHGLLKLSPGDLDSVELDTPGGGLNRAVFRNGSVLAGLLPPGKIALKARLGFALEVSPPQARRLVFVGPRKDDAALASMTLRNADLLLGRFADEKWQVVSKVGTIAVAAKDIAEAEFSDESLGQVNLVLRDGTKLSGKLGDDYVNFKIEPGPTVKVFVGHLASAKGAGAPPSTQPTTTQPAAAPTAGVAPTAAASGENPAGLAQMRERLKQLNEMIAQAEADAKKNPTAENRTRLEKLVAETREYQLRIAAMMKAEAARAWAGTR